MQKKSEFQFFNFTVLCLIFARICSYIVATAQFFATLI